MKVTLAKLIKPIHKGNLKVVSDLLKREEFVQLVNETDKHGCTPIFYATYKGYVDICKALLNEGKADCKKVCRGFRPIHVACSRGYTQLVKLYLDQGDTITEKELKMIESRGNVVSTEIHEMIQKPLQIVTDECKKISEGPANDFQSSSSSESMENTTHLRTIDLERESLKKRTVPQSSSSTSEFENTWARRRAKRRTRVASASLSRDETDKKLISLAMQSIKDGNLKKLKNIVSSGIDLNRIGTGKWAGMTVLSVASKFKRYEMVLYLVKHGAQYAQTKSPLKQTKPVQPIKKEVTSKVMTQLELNSVLTELYSVNFANNATIQQSLSIISNLSL